MSKNTNWSDLGSKAKQDAIVRQVSKQVRTKTGKQNPSGPQLPNLALLAALLLLTAMPAVAQDRWSPNPGRGSAETTLGGGTK